MSIAEISSSREYLVSGFIVADNPEAFISSLSDSEIDIIYDTLEPHFNHLDVEASTTIYTNNRDQKSYQLLAYMDELGLQDVGTYANATPDEDAVFEALMGEKTDGSYGMTGGSVQKQHEANYQDTNIGDSILTGRKARFIPPTTINKLLGRTEDTKHTQQIADFLCTELERTTTGKRAATIKHEGEEYYVNSVIAHGRKRSGFGTTPWTVFADSRIVGYIGESLGIVEKLPEDKAHYVHPTSLSSQYLHTDKSIQGKDKVELALGRLAAKNPNIPMPDGSIKPAADLMGYYRRNTGTEGIYSDPVLAPHVSKEMGVASILPSDKEHFLSYPQLNRALHRSGEERNTAEVKAVLNELLEQAEANPNAMITFGDSAYLIQDIVVRAARETGETGRGVASIYADPVIIPYMANRLKVASELTTEQNHFLSPTELNRAMGRDAGDGRIQQVEEALEAMVKIGKPLKIDDDLISVTDVIRRGRRGSNTGYYADPIAVPAIEEHLGISPRITDDLEKTYVPFSRMRAEIPGGKVGRYKEELDSMVQTLLEEPEKVVLNGEYIPPLLSKDGLKHFRDAKGKEVLYAHKDMETFFDEHFIGKMPEGENFMGSASRICRHSAIGLRDTPDRVKAVKQILDDLYERRDEPLQTDAGEDKMGNHVRRLAHGRNIGIHIREEMLGGELLNRENIEALAAEIAQSRSIS